MSNQQWAASKRARRRVGDSRRLPPLPYRLEVIGTDVTETVCGAGGRMYDSAASGWQVNVRVPALENPHPLRILGAQPRLWQSPLTSYAATVLAVSAKLLSVDPELRRQVLAVVRRGATEVIAWGPDCPAEVGHELGHITYQLSDAGRAFKAQAVWAATGLRADVDSAERFRGGPPQLQTEIRTAP